MKNIDVIKQFLIGNSAISHTGSLKSTGDKLFSYYTCIAQHHDGKILINVVKYSTTTSCHLGRLQREAHARNIKLTPVSTVFYNNKECSIPIGFSDLTSCYV